MSRFLPTADSPLTLEQGAMLARAIDAAAHAAAAGNLAAAWRRLAPYVDRPLPDALAGRFWELTGACAGAGLHGLDLRTALNRARMAFGQEHDLAGLSRVHAALGSLLFAQGELSAAARELERAAQLTRSSRGLAERIGALSRQAEVSLCLADGPTAAMQLQGAMALCQTIFDPSRDALEAQVRSLSAQAAMLCGDRSQSARDLLWAERLAQGAHFSGLPQAGLSGSIGASLGPAAGPAVAMAMLRAEALLMLGYPRRALGALTAANLRPDADPAGAPIGIAHLQRIRGTALLLDRPHEALAALTAAERAFARARQPYFVAFCQVGLVRAARRCNDPRAGHYDEVLAHHKMARWPLLERMWRANRQVPIGTVARVTGEVQLPWVREIGHSKRAHGGQQGPAEQPPAAEQTPGSLLGKLQRAVGRWQ